MAIKISQADSIFSRLIRERDEWTCVRCNTRYTPPTNALHCSHFWGRANKNTRFDPLNCDALCYGCHSLWEGNKQGDYRDFKIAQLGIEGYDRLERRARTSIKFGAYELKQKIAELKQVITLAH